MFTTYPLALLFIIHCLNVSTFSIITTDTFTAMFAKIKNKTIYPITFLALELSVTSVNTTDKMHTKKHVASFPIVIIFSLRVSYGLSIIT